MGPPETYQIDSDDYDSDEERENLSSEEFELLAEEGRSSFTPWILLGCILDCQCL